MRRHSGITVMMALLLAVGLLLTACQSAPDAPAAKADEKAKTAAPAKTAVQPKAEAPAKAAAKEPYKIGVLGEFSGAAAAAGVGTDVRDGAMLEVERINAAGGVNGTPIELVVEDSGSDPTKLTTSLTKLIRQDRVLAAFGPTFSGIVAAGVSIAEREQTPVILNQVLPPDQRKGMKWTFSQNLGEVGTSDSMIDILQEKGWKKVVAIGDASPSWNSVFERFKSQATSQGFQVFTTADTFTVKDLDLTPHVGKLKELAAKEKAQALVLVTHGQAGVPFLKAAKQLGLDLPVVAPWGFGMPYTLTASGDEVNGVLFAGFKLLAPNQLDNADPMKPLIVDYVKRFQAKYGREASAPAGLGPDGVNLIANALKTAGPDRAKIRDALENAKNVVALYGVYNLKNREGLGKESLAVYQIKEKKFTFVRGIK